MQRDHQHSADQSEGADLATGFVEDTWYVILESRRLGRGPLSVTRLGQRMVLWRDRDGRVVATDAGCPHRGADLGLGRVIDGQLECPYHGFRFDASGACTLVPCEGRDYAIPAGLEVVPYTVIERYGLIWLWWPAGGVARRGDAGAPASIPWFEGVPESPRGSYTATMTWNVPYARAAEGMLDIHHAPFAHRYVMPGVGTRLDPYEVAVEGDLIRTAGVLRKDGAPYAGKGGFRFGLAMRFPGLFLGELGRRVRVVGAMTPIDHERTWIVFRYHVQIPVLGRFVAWLACQAELRLVQKDDQRLQESSLPRHLDVRENRYVPADAGMLQWHKLYRARMKAQGIRRHLAVVAEPTRACNRV
jgi:phenylpropionate dioxygenase-like ring-hydroxylating dioxygenase large terminal subunit